MKKYTVPILTIILLAVISCRDSEIVSDQSNVNGVNVETVLSEEDITSDEVVYKAQSDFENMLMDQIIYLDSVYILNMSQEEAKDLTIPDSLYEVYVNVVKDLNGNINEK